MIYLELFLTFLEIGAFTFGGGYAMLPLIQSAVLNKEWMAEQTLIDFVAVSESTPGPFAINISTYVGSEMGGILGSICATAGVVLPSFVIILIVAKCFDKFKESRWIKGFMSGLKPAVVGLIGTAVLSIAKTVFIPNGVTFLIFTTPVFYLSAVIFILSTVLAFRKTHPIIIICISAVLGIIGGYLI